MTDPLLRIAAALERLAPPPPAPADPRARAAYLWRDGTLVEAAGFAPVPAALLSGIDAQKAAAIENGRRHARGLPAHDILLWGARGTGKSALAKSSIAAVRGEGFDLALVELSADAFGSLPGLFALLRAVPRRYVLFIDDLGFDDDPGAARRLRSLLEGGADARPENLRLYVTSNRRHIVARDIAEQDSAINPRDVVDDRLALADRFGLSLGFHAVDQAGYLAMVEGYAREYGLPFDAADAVGWATRRGGRSGRVAWQYVVEVAGREGRRLG